MDYRIPCDNCNRTGKENGEPCWMCFGEGQHTVSKAERDEYYRNTGVAGNKVLPNHFNWNGQKKMKREF